MYFGGYGNYRTQAELLVYKDKYDKPRTENDELYCFKKQLSSEQHSVVARELYQLLERLSHRPTDLKDKNGEIL